MKVSIITVTFNSENTVNDTLLSIQGQDYGNIEHIIIDGASKDKTLDIVKSYKHVTKIISEQDKGIYDAMNKGLRLATGDIIGILNSDDFYSSNQIISQIVNCFNENRTDTVYGDLEYVDSKNTDKVVRTWLSGNYKKKNFYYGWMPPHPTFFVRKELYLKYGMFNTNFKMAADYEFMLRLLFKNNISTSYLSKIIVKMRVGGLSNSNLKNRLRANNEDSKAWKINNLKPKFYTFLLKPTLKIKQYF